ncbi:MAG: hypothetical protein VB878_07860 [Pirellulaceae bacterium]
METQYAPLIRWALDAAVLFVFAAILAIPTILGLSVTCYSLFAIGYAIGCLALPFLTWGRVFPAPRRAERRELETLCIRRCRIWDIVYTVNGTRYLLPQFVATIGWVILVITVAMIAVFVRHVANG